jgi:hypothetical protein
VEKSYPGEQWKPIVFDFGFVNETRIEISNSGCLKTFNKVSNGNIIKGTMINGYKIIRLKFYKAREESVQHRFNYLKQQILQLTQKINHLKTSLNNLRCYDDAYLSVKRNSGIPLFYLQS